MFCCDKHMFVVIKVCLSQLLSRQNYICCDKYLLRQTHVGHDKSFVATSVFLLHQHCRQIICRVFLFAWSVLHQCSHQQCGQMYTGCFFWFDEFSVLDRCSDFFFLLVWWILLWCSYWYFGWMYLGVLLTWCILHHHLSQHLRDITALQTYINTYTVFSFLGVFYISLQVSSLWANVHVFI